MTPTLTHRALAALAVTLMACSATPGQAQTAGTAQATAAPKAAAMTEAEVRKIDKAKGRITLKHARIEHLDMAGMTMAFRVADPSWLDRLQVGDKVKVMINEGEGGLTVTAIEPLR